MQEINDINENTPLEQISDPFLQERNISLFIQREDLLHPQISGNKWYKLKYNLSEAKVQGKDTLLTFGGAYSNHIYSVAAAGKIFKLNTIGVIRGEENSVLNSTLSFAKDCGMIFYYLNRSDYKNKDSEEILGRLKRIFGDFYLLPEGGTNQLAVKGCCEIISKLKTEFDYVCCPCGTGGTLAGLISGLTGNNFALGFAILKNASFLKDNVRSVLKSSDKNNLNNWDINLDYHFGGYAKTNTQLSNFTQKFSLLTGIPIETIYTGKMLFGIYDLVSKGFFKEGTRIVAIHTGGLQSSRILSQKIMINDKDYSSEFES